MKKLSSEIDILNGFAFKSKDYCKDGIFILRTKNFNSGSIAERLPDDVFLPEEFLLSHEKYLVEPFDYHLIMVGASVGNRGLVFPHLLPSLRNQNMWCFRAKAKAHTSQAFVKYLLDFLVSKLTGLASGSAREFFRKGDFGNQMICIGNEAIQSAFSKQVTPLLNSMASLEEQSQTLTQLRDSLLPKLLSGEISVDAATANTKEAV